MLGRNGRCWDTEAVQCREDSSAVMFGCIHIMSTKIEIEIEIDTASGHQALTDLRVTDESVRP